MQKNPISYKGKSHFWLKCVYALCGVRHFRGYNLYIQLKLLEISRGKRPFFSFFIFFALSPKLGTVYAINIGTKNYLVPSATGFALETADVAGTGLTLKKVGTGVLHIGQPSIAKSVYTTYKYVVEIN